MLQLCDGPPLLVYGVQLHKNKVNHKGVVHIWHKIAINILNSQTGKCFITGAGVWPM